MPLLLLLIDAHVPFLNKKAPRYQIIQNQFDPSYPTYPAAAIPAEHRSTLSAIYQQHTFATGRPSVASAGARQGCRRPPGAVMGAGRAERGAAGDHCVPRPDVSLGVSDGARTGPDWAALLSASHGQAAVSRRRAHMHVQTHTQVCARICRARSAMMGGTVDVSNAHFLLSQMFKMYFCC